MSLHHILFSIVVSVLVIPSSSDASSKNRVPKSTKLAGLLGGELTSSELRGKVTVVEFFASWCEGCSDVMKKLDKIPTHDGSQFKVVSVDESMGEAKGYFKRKPDIKNLEKIAYFDRDALLAESLGVESLPAVFVIGKDGRVIKKVHGHPTGQDYKHIRRLLGR